MHRGVSAISDGSGPDAPFQLPQNNTAHNEAVTTQGNQDSESGGRSWGNWTSSDASNGEETSPTPASPTAAPSRSYAIGNDLIAQTDGSTVRQMLYDAGGSVRGLLDATGRPVTDQVYDYDAYGNRLTTAGNTITPATDLLYRGELLDATLGQYVLRARYYDPSAGRFTSFDDHEASDPLGLHKYLYANSNPVGRRTGTQSVSTPENGLRPRFRPPR